MRDTEIEAWRQRLSSDRSVICGWTDGMYVKDGLERDKAAQPVMTGAMRDGMKEILAPISGCRESTQSRAAASRNLEARGLRVTRRLFADGMAAICRVARAVWPESAEQWFSNHKKRNVLDRLPKREQPEANPCGPNEICSCPFPVGG